MLVGGGHTFMYHCTFRRLNILLVIGRTLALEYSSDILPLRWNQPVFSFGQVLSIKASFLSCWSSIAHFRFYTNPISTCFSQAIWSTRHCTREVNIFESRVIRAQSQGYEARFFVGTSKKGLWISESEMRDEFENLEKSQICRFNLSASGVVWSTFSFRFFSIP